MDPTLSRWQLFWKVLHMQAPPALAPGVLVQLGAARPDVHLP